MSKRNIIRLEKHPRRIYLLDRHLHHGLQGVILLIIGLVLIITDYRDFPFRFAKDSSSYE